MLGKIWHWVQHFAACATTVFVLKYVSMTVFVACFDFLKQNLWFCREDSGVTRGEVETSAPGAAFWGRKLRLECHVTTTKCQMSADASNYDLQNVECQSLLPCCKISSRSQRFVKRAIANFSSAIANYLMFRKFDLWRFDKLHVEMDLMWFWR